MVKTYSKNANRNMRRPIVSEAVLAFMRGRQQQNDGGLARLEDFARKENIPIIPQETAAYFRLLMQVLQPQKILEIGTAIGFSALLMAENAPKSEITTIDRNPEMIALAKANFAKYDSRGQIRLLEGDASDILTELDETYDFVFMDSAKSKYIVFLPAVLERLAVGGLVILDDVFQGGDVTKPIEEIHRSQRAIYRGLQKLFDATLAHPDLTASLLPLGDGLLMIRKNSEEARLSD
ncbi:O-methyltransferase [Streptococcus ratti]|uniref:tRNA 5-hydroxyuridine methyltransferase n=1 Tax=Streptococcus ratti FA-1 = DSM 20564 TaxID=699248 RepID=A0ABP2QZ39_STRRT|nr:O-methyltransferase [Streptococcus ratti]EJN94323.1 O-methyltransferase family protein [Streptococcus ratti FA-1 = DSM 20564]EMP70982.1 O-methyltransferase yrrM [Streptococcus ratti FA-1 = DSM 20564]QEY06273.1 O-methyltransferase [Streptococcus ratti]VEI60615.1 O-methyltransferase family protein [C1] [Streptococcus mutans]